MVSRRSLMLDTSVCIELMRPASARSWPGRVEALDAADVSISSIVMAELRFGAENSKNRDARTLEIRDLLRHFPVEPFDEGAAVEYGTARKRMESDGMKIGDLDLLIGAHALSLGAGIATLDKRDFKRIPGLYVDLWSR